MVARKHVGLGKLDGSEVVVSPVIEKTPPSHTVEPW